MRELSDGYRGVIAIVSDVARRAAQLHPQPDRNILDNATGVVVIDEIDLHMHPGWQRTVIPNLRRTFPKIQFIVTTHSAEVLSSVDNENVRALESDGVRDTELYVMGRDSNSILVDTMRAGERPPGGADLLRNLYEAVDGGNFQRAEELLVEARELWGPHDAHLAEVEAQLQLER
jgi:predicted ATP-binding protein involved in virulence